MIEARDRTLNKAVRYGYDLRSLRNRMEVVDYDASSTGSLSMAVTYMHDKAGRLLSIQKDSDPAAVYTYDLSGRRTGLILPNGVTTTYTYDQNDRLLNLVTARDSTVLASFAYSLDPTGNRTGITYADGSRSVYTFDQAYRLTGDRRLDANDQILYDETYTYDPVGNRLTKRRTGWNPVSVDYTYNTRNQLVSTSGTEAKKYNYDANGSIIFVMSASAANSEIMNYDVMNRLIRYEGPNGVEEIVYRGSEWHQWQITETPMDSVSIQTMFLYDTDTVIADYNPTNLSKLYITPFLDQNLSMTICYPNATNYYYSNDGLNNVRSLTTSTGIITNQYDYTAFGEPYSKLTHIPQRYTYTGREVRGISPEIFYRYRHLSPTEGIFNRRDPSTYTSNLAGNLFNYVNSNPVSFTDPYGLKIKIVGDAGSIETIFQAIKKICPYVTRDKCGVLHHDKDYVYIIPEQSSFCNRLSSMINDDQNREIYPTSDMAKPAQVDGHGVPTLDHGDRNENKESMRINPYIPPNVDPHSYIGKDVPNYIEGDYFKPPLPVIIAHEAGHLWDRTRGLPSNEKTSVWMENLAWKTIGTDIQRVFY